MPQEVLTFEKPLPNIVLRQLAWQQRNSGDPSPAPRQVERSPKQRDFPIDRSVRCVLRLPMLDVAFREIRSHPCHTYRTEPWSKMLAGHSLTPPVILAVDLVIPHEYIEQFVHHEPSGTPFEVSSRDHLRSPLV